MGSMIDPLDSGERFPRELEILRQLADNIPQLVWVTRPDGAHDEYYNRNWFEFTGLTPETSDERGWNQLFHPDDLERSNSAGQRLCARAINTRSSSA